LVRIGSHIDPGPITRPPVAPPAPPTAPKNTPTSVDAMGPAGTTVIAPIAPLSPREGLPEILFSRKGAKVEHGTDPGDFYCEHLFFSAQTEAAKPGSSVQKNARGEALVGFLHVPHDAHLSGDASDTYTEAARHAGTRKVVGAALRGYFEDALPNVKSGPIKILLTGYGPFDWIKNNPTGDFTTHVENIDAAMKEAFGKRLLSSGGRLLKKKSVEGVESRAYEYRVKDSVSSKERTVIIEAHRLPVDDHAIDGADPRSIQKAIARLEPHAVLSMGTAPGEAFRAEFHADSGGMTTGGAPHHVPDAPATVSLGDNYSLARALVRSAAKDLKR